MSNLRLFLRLSRPLYLLGGAVNYMLGVGIARYLGQPLNEAVLVLGLFWVASLQLATHYLNEYFDHAQDALNPNRTPFTGGSGVLGSETPGIGEGKLQPVVALFAAYTMLAIVVFLTYAINAAGVLNPLVLFIMVLAILGAIFYSVPPVRLAGSGVGELTTSTLLAILVPAFAFGLQVGELHRLLALTTLPLLPLTMATMLGLEFPDYFTDAKVGKLVLFVRLGWENAVRLHHMLVTAAYILLAVSFVYGLPAAIALPPFLTLPLALFQIWYMTRIADGAKPNWTILTLTALAMTALTAYLITYAFWTR
jgi:1,4-dihydroxy-2-naphthoate octaprenyltransferase